MHLTLRNACTMLIMLALTTSVFAQGQDRGRRGGRADRLRPDPVLLAIDTDRDGALSVEEIANAPIALLELDVDGDENLTTNELQPQGAQQDDRRGPPRGPGGPGGPGGRRGMSPVTTALDLDKDGELFEDEITDAATLLLALDQDNNGALSTEELTPVRGRRPGGQGGPPDGPGGRRGEPRDGGGAQGPVPRPEELDFNDAVASVPDREMFKALSYQGPEVMVDTHLAGLEFVKFQIEDALSDDPKLYFMNTKTHRSHPGFMRTIGIDQSAGRGRVDGRMRGVLVFHPMLQSPNGEPGLFTFEFEPNDEYPLEEIQLARDLLAKHSGLMRGRLAYNLMPRALERYEREQTIWDESDLTIFKESDHFSDVAFLPLHQAESFGRLRLMALHERPDQRDVVIYPTLPNEMPRVAGVITGVQQTPLSHVNLRAVQDDIPNAYVAGVESNKTVNGLLGKYVYFRVDADGYLLREATKAEFDAHFADLRPKSKQTPRRDLSETRIKPFDQIHFEDAANVGMKAASLAELGSLNLRDELTPDGYAVPFVFYDAFMKHNGFYKLATQMQSANAFRTSADARAKALEQFQKAIKKGKMPKWMMDALADVHSKFPRGTSVRCRSSTNNEDLPGFSGAGLYDSFTHHPDEGHLSKSIKQVFASLWNFRAYEERSFHRIDHMAAAMGVVLHPNTSNELANGVAVTHDILYQTYQQLGVRYYVNAQVGENLVTNPEGGAIPEELLLSPRNPRTDRTIRHSSLADEDTPILDDDHLAELRTSLRLIDKHFRSLYEVSGDEAFAMEVEFKVIEDGRLFIKQARPWVF